MPRRKPTPAEEPPYPVPPAFLDVTPNQVVAYNLARARAWRGWTQEQATAALEPHLGTRWSKANYSAAERSIAGGRIRQFDADEIVAFAQAFGVPVGWFFLPPPPWAPPGVPLRLAAPDREHLGEVLAALVDMVFGDDEGQALLAMRLQTFLDQLGPSLPLTRAQERVVGLVGAKVEALVRHGFRDLGSWQTQLRALANQLEDLQRRAGVEVHEDLYGDPVSGEDGDDAGVEDDESG